MYNAMYWATGHRQTGRWAVGSWGQDDPEDFVDSEYQTMLFSRSTLHSDSKVQGTQMHSPAQDSLGPHDPLQSSEKEQMSTEYLRQQHDSCWPSTGPVLVLYRLGRAKRPGQASPVSPLATQKYRPASESDATSTPNPYPLVRPSVRPTSTSTSASTSTSTSTSTSISMPVPLWMQDSVAACQREKYSRMSASVGSARA